MIENSIGTRLFNSVIVSYRDSDTVVDVLNDGEYSCAFFVSSVLTLVQFLDRPHTTVKTVRLKLEERGWSKIPAAEAELGDVIFWEKVKFDNGSENEHVGFVGNSTEAISTSYLERKVVRHDIFFRKEGADHLARAVSAVYRLP